MRVLAREMQDLCLNLKEEGCCCIVLRYHQNELTHFVLLTTQAVVKELLVQGARDHFT